VLFPGKYTYTVTERDDIARHALEDLDPSFVANVRQGDIVVGGRNFGCGSSREQAATCLVYNGVGAVIAESFSRIFYRNALNNGLLAIVCPAAAQAIAAGEAVEVDAANNLVRCAAGEFSFAPLSAGIMGIVEAGGLVEYVKRRLAPGQAEQGPDRAAP
jgi:3-isopropylmalate/(R)-2-methylmalate dehydratase small subunit